MPKSFTLDLVNHKGKNCFAEVGDVRMLRMVIPEQLPQQRKVKRRSIFGFIFIIKNSIAVSVPAPVGGSAMDQPYHEVYGQ